MFILLNCSGKHFFGQFFFFFVKKRKSLRITLENNKKNRSSVNHLSETKIALDIKCLLWQELHLLDNVPLVKKALLSPPKSQMSQARV